MRFGGHETFAVREDWLSKGLFLLQEDPQVFDDPFFADSLGVGRNMAKSIRHWLYVTGLISKPGRDEPPRLTSLGQTILKYDPYMLQNGTWWALHINLVAQDREAIAWPWFFNRFARDRFDRLECVEQLQRFIALEGQTQPSPTTLARDIACLLASYALSVPPDRTDPEDAQDSPFRRLGLITHHRDSGTYSVNRRLKAIPPELVGYAFARSWTKETQDGQHIDIGFTKALAHPGGPGRAFTLTAEGLMQLLSEAEATLGEREIHTHLMGAERTIQVKGRLPTAWLEGYYQRVHQP